VVQCTDAVPVGTVAMPFHWTPLRNRGAWVNRITIAALDPTSRQPELKHAAVRLERGTVGLDGLHVVGAKTSGLRDELATALAAAGVRDLRVTGFDVEPSSGHPWLLVTNGEGSARWLQRRGLSRPLVVDAGARVVDTDGAYAVGPGVRVVGGSALTADASRLAAALLAGGAGGARALSCAEWSGSASTVHFVAGDPDPSSDDEAQDVQRIVVADGGTGLRVRWRLGAGQVLGVAATGPPAMLGRIADLWMEDATPEEIRAGRYLA
jgi:hypothetical protein